MKVIVGTIIKEDNKILMVKEAKKDYYGKWNFPAGHLEENEDIFSGAIRETLEETGHKVVLTRMLPIQIIQKNGEIIHKFMFMASIVQKNAAPFIKEEIIETEFISIEDIRKNSKDLRNSYENIKLLDLIEEDVAFKLDEIFI